MTARKSALGTCDVGNEVYQDAGGMSGQQCGFPGLGLTGAS